MFTPGKPTTERPRFRSEREYREWQLSLRSIVPVKRYKNESVLARLVSTVRRLTARPLHSAAESRRIEQEASGLRGY